MDASTGMLPVCFLFLQRSPAAEFAAVEHRRGGERGGLPLPRSKSPRSLFMTSGRCRLVGSAPPSIQPHPLGLPTLCLVKMCEHLRATFVSLLRTNVQDSSALLNTGGRLTMDVFSLFRIVLLYMEWRNNGYQHDNSSTVSDILRRLVEPQHVRNICFL